MNRTEDANIIQNSQESNTSITEKIGELSKHLWKFREAEYDFSTDDEIKKIIGTGDAKITVGIYEGNKLITFTITKNGVVRHEELLRQRTLDNN